MTQDQLLSRPIPQMLLRMAAPIALGMLSTFTFQVVDTWFVGRLGADALAALGFAGSIYLLLVSLCVGVAVGVSSLVASALGRGDAEGARQTAMVSMTVVSLVVTALSVAGIVASGPLFRALGAPPELLAPIDDYMRWIFAGLPLLTAALMANAALGATGDTTRPAMAFLLGGAINLVLDAALIFGFGPVPALGLQGAAIATVISWVFILVRLLTLMARHDLLARPASEGALSTTQELLRFAAPAVAAQVLLPLSVVVLTYLAAQSGPEVVAAVGVAGKVESLALVGISALNVALVPLVAQNHAAGKGLRVLGIRRTARWSAFAWGAAAALLLLAFAGPHRPPVQRRSSGGRSPEDLPARAGRHLRVPRGGDGEQRGAQRRAAPPSQPGPPRHEDPGGGHAPHGPGRPVRPHRPVRGGGGWPCGRCRAGRLESLNPPWGAPST